MRTLCNIRLRVEFNLWLQHSSYWHQGCSFHDSVSWEGGWLHVNTSSGPSNSIRIISKLQHDIDLISPPGVTSKCWNVILRSVENFITIKCQRQPQAVGRHSMIIDRRFSGLSRKWFWYRPWPLTATKMRVKLGATLPVDCPEARHSSVSTSWITSSARIVASVSDLVTSTFFTASGTWLRMTSWRVFEISRRCIEQCAFAVRQSGSLSR